MPNTTNFNFPTPADTDLVKDGASAIRSLGNSIDTAFVDLKGGTSGQVLSKASNTDLDFTWVAQDDSNAIQNAIVDAKGDLISATAADTPARLAVGANDTVLTADSSTSTGLKWAAPASASGPAFSVTRSTAQTITGGVTTKIQWNSETFDTDNCFDSTTNYRFTPNKAGKYQINVTVGCEDDAAAYSYCYLYKNGSSILQNAVMITTSSVGNTSNSYAHLVDMNGTTDYLEVYVNFLNTAAINDNTADRFSGVWIRS